MDKNAIKTFAIESRRKLMLDVEYQMNIIGITSKGISEPSTKAEGMESYILNGVENTIYDKQIQQRNSLVQEVQSKGYENVIEEVAYTWFNRIIAIRYMEVNDYLPTRTRVLSSETEGKIEPDIITEAFDLDLNYTNEDQKTILQLKDENKLDELFQFLFIKQCNKLNEILPGLFEKTEDYSELLLNISFTDSEGIVRQLEDTIPEDNFKQEVEIIGWLYQYYNKELKDETFSDLKKNIKISKEKIPAATQLFTPDWIVKYMVENSLGRYWLNSHPNNHLKEKWVYYVENSEQNLEIEKTINELNNNHPLITPEDITLIDPCMGSGHILVYAFDVLMDIYRSEGYSEKDSVESILKNNIYGLDIDDRAYQLSYFAIMMKARQYNRKIFSLNITPKLCSIAESNNLNDDFLKVIINKNKDLKNEFIYLKDIFHNAKNYGCILNLKRTEINQLKTAMNNVHSTTKLDIYDNKKNTIINSLIKQLDLLTRKYDIVVTNPPYMGQRGMNTFLKEYVKTYYPISKSDLSTVFMEKCMDLCEDYGYISMINIPVWMFLSTYKELRDVLINEKTFINLLHFGRGVFGSDFGSTAFVLYNYNLNGFQSKFHQLYRTLQTVDSVEKKEKFFFNKNNIFTLNQNTFKNIPGNPIAYWVTDEDISNFIKGDPINKYIDTFQGIITGNNKKFLRVWYELSINKIAFDEINMEDVNLNKTYWIPYNKGGEYRRWYGNQEYVVNWKNGASDKTRGKKTFSEYYLRDYVSWSYITFSTLSTRYFPKGFLWDVAGSGMFDKKDYLKYLQGLLSSKIGIHILKIINPTLNFQVEHILQIPIIYNEKYKIQIDKIVQENIDMAKDDWDSFETSWNFKKHPLLKFKDKNIERSFKNWLEYKNNLFIKMKNNENTLNRLFIEIYNLQKQLTNEISDDDITLYIPNIEKDIKSLISYYVGIVFGRYSLDKEGVIFAGGNFDITKYQEFIPDEDNIIPVLDTAYFEDDIVGRFIEFLKITFGEEELENNINFIAKALGNKKDTSRETIRNYFLNDFYKDHIKEYQVKSYNKAPIYWEFNSGKYNGFKCLVYMHRYNPDLVSKVRTEYLHETQKKLEQAKENCDKIINNTNSKSEKSKATKEKNKLIKQIEETKEYDEALAHIANQRIEIDLDDGVKVNYAKFQNVNVSKEGLKTKKISLLTKI